MTEWNCLLVSVNRSRMPDATAGIIQQSQLPENLPPHWVKVYRQALGAPSCGECYRDRMHVWAHQVWLGYTRSHLKMVMCYTRSLFGCLKNIFCNGYNLFSFCIFFWQIFKYNHDSNKPFEIVFVTNHYPECINSEKIPHISHFDLNLRYVECCLF